QIIPPDTVFTSGPGEASGGTPPIDTAFIDGTIGWRRHHEGHTPIPDWPDFMRLTARHFNDNRPVVTPSQHFRCADRPGSVVGTVLATDMDNDRLGNWQIIGGSGVGEFTIEPDTGRITVARHHPVRRRNYTLS